MSNSDGAAIAVFIEKWRQSAAAERANKDSFLNELCAVLDVPAPDPTTGDAKRDNYVFEKAVQCSSETGRTTKFIDLYKRGCFVLEAKQGSESAKGKLGTAKRRTGTWDVAMNAAFHQAAGYAVALEQSPPLVLVADLGFCVDIYASFDGTPRYRPLKLVRGHHRVYFSELEKYRDLLRALFLDPLSLDPSKVATQVTRDVAVHLARLTRRLENAGHAPELVADFLLRSIFCMFAEDVGLLPNEMFTNELRGRWIADPKSFPAGVESLWRAMNDGSVFGFFGKLLHFNGGLFKSPTALPLDRGDLEVLLEAASCSWNQVEPAIFGALFEGALDSKERHDLGAHFTPRAYVERLVRPTIEEPVRTDWEATQGTIRDLAAKGRVKEAKAATRAFMKRLTEIRVLDPACGSGNFLIVALDLLKAIEDEAFALLLALENGQAELCLSEPEVTPRQFLGIEVNPRAKSIAELVLWIGYLQWHFKTKHRGGKPREPVLEDYKNIALRDAVLVYDSKTEARDARTGKAITRWDGQTTKRHPATKELIPDDRFTIPVYKYTNPRPAQWPAADFIVGNPPFIGNKRMRAALGDGYVDALREAHGDVPETADFVMYWWNQAARRVAADKALRAGLITTNSITQTFSRKIVDRHLDQGKISLVFAIPDHPWVDARDGAAVRIAMTVLQQGKSPGRLQQVLAEDEASDGVSVVSLESRGGMISSALSVDAKPSDCKSLRANAGLSFMGVTLIGDGFRLTVSDVARLAPGKLPSVIRPYVMGRDLAQKSERRWVVDFFGLSEEAVRKDWGRLYQHVLNRVKPEREQNSRKLYRDRWWVFGEPREGMRKATSGLKQFIVTARTARFRIFQMVSNDVLVDSNVVAIATDDYYVLGVLSSRLHSVWALAAGATLEDRPHYTSSTTFEPFPFPEVRAAERERIAELAESIDQHRKRHVGKSDEVTITAIYNIVEKLRGGESLTSAEQALHDLALVSLLQKLHDELDAAVLAAYGLHQNTSDGDLLSHLVVLNGERLAEESRGNVHWLRPEHQHVASGNAPTFVAGARQRKGPGLAATRPPAAQKKRSKRVGK